MRYRFDRIALGLTSMGMLAVSPGAFAGEGEHHAGAPARFESMDTNGDGKVSADEHTAAAKKMFDMMDADHDGKVTAAEMTAAHEKVAGAKAPKTEMSATEKMKAVDTNGDGVLTAEEHAAGAKKMFEAMDTDHDGFLSKAELTAGHAKMMKKEKPAK